MKEQNHPNVIKIRNAHVHNLKHIDVDIPLNKIVGIAGVSGSGKSSLALGVLYAEGSREWVSHMPDALLDEPSIGLHPSNIVGLTDVMHDLIADGVYFIC